MTGCSTTKSCACLLVHQPLADPVGLAPADAGLIDGGFSSKGSSVQGS
jgi:hypothetical protein